MSNTKAIRLEAQLTGFSSKADGSLGFRGTTQEMSSSEKVVLMDLQGLLVDLLVIPKEDKQSEMVEVKGHMDGKSPGQRLRGIMFIFWKKKYTGTENTQTFESFYTKSMDAISEKWLKAIDDLE